MLKYHLIAIALGAMIGANSRYFLIIQTDASSFPFMTMLINVSGSFLLGYATSWFATKKWRQEWVVKGITVGLFGGFTTMSTFAADYITLLDQGMYMLAILYFSGSIFISILFAWIGYRLGGKKKGLSKWMFSL